MKSKLRRLLFAALLLSNTSMTFAEDGASAVGDLPAYNGKSEVIPALPVSGPSANRVGDLSFIGAGNPNTVSDLGSNYVSDDSSNVVSDFGSNVVGDVAPGFIPSGERGTVVIGLAPSMLTELPESARSNFVEAVPLPIIAPPTTVASEALNDPTEVRNAIDSADAKVASAKATETAQKVEQKTTTPDGLQNVEVQPFQAIALESEADSTTDCDCGEGETCDGGCETSCEPKRAPRIGKLLNRSPKESWLSTEFLLWHTQDRKSPALVATAPPSTFPVLPNAQVVFGDNLEGEFSGGFRLDAGKHLTENLGVGVRFWILANNNDSFFADARPNQISMGRPFFYPLAGVEDSLTISGIGGNLPSPGNFEGTVVADSAVNMWAAEAYARLRLNCHNNCRIDFLSGYSHLNLDDDLRISSESIIDTTGQTFEFHDAFETSNQFNGGQLGFEISLNEGRWTFRSMTKVHLGNMNQQVSIDGSHAFYNLGDPVVYTDGGFLAAGNQGDYERDKFAFIPEANLKVEYSLRENVSLSIGYSFLYFDNVALAGGQVDRIVDPVVLTGPFPPFAANPAFKFNDSGMWVQGLDLGLRWDF
ncbi:MAG: hypothetical protein CMM01_02475 [Rhodopirellula sp.]|nr:hypothetical protein [Rhodopirellula sp.]